MRPEIVLYQPEIPPNTGNVARLAAATGVALHLVRPLGFSLEDKHLKRAGLDYWPRVALTVWDDWEEARRAALDAGRRLVCTTARAGAAYHDFAFTPADWIVLGPETRGLPESVLAQGELVRIPVTDAVRSLNLATAAGVLVYEALRQCGLTPSGGPRRSASEEGGGGARSGAAE